MAEESYEWRAQQANDGKARSFELWDVKAFKAVLNIRARQPVTIDEIRRLVSLAK